jgi:hypothetical protein
MGTHNPLKTARSPISFVEDYCLKSKEHVDYNGHRTSSSSFFRQFLLFLGLLIQWILQNWWT